MVSACYVRQGSEARRSHEQLIRRLLEQVGPASACPPRVQAQPPVSPSGQVSRGGLEREHHRALPERAGPDGQQQLPGELRGGGARGTGGVQPGGAPPLQVGPVRPRRPSQTPAQLDVPLSRRLIHGIGRSGDIAAVQPKAAGSSLLNKLSNALLLDVLRLSGGSAATSSRREGRRGRRPA